jgi:signal transduction histidine kinase
MLANVGTYVGVSLAVSPSADEHRQASLFVDVFRLSGEAGGARFWRGTASVPELYNLLARFLGSGAADSAFAEYARAKGLPWPDQRLVADADLVHYVEVQLAGAIGAASARVMVGSVVKEEALTLDEVREILDEASQVVVYSHRLEQKSRELEAATTELREANERLKELDRLKDEFVSTVTHELRTPLTSIRAFTEILLDDPDVELGQRKNFLGIITKETERLTRLINQVLDLAKIESGKAEWVESAVDMKEVISDTLAAMGQLFKEKNIVVEAGLPERVSPVTADLDRMIQVMLNLLSNAVKFCDAASGRIGIALTERDGCIRVDVRDNGRGISAKDQGEIFSKFHQVGGVLADKPRGSGLGLHISRQIVEHFGGRMWVESEIGRGACFSFTLPTGAAAGERFAQALAGHAAGT